MTTTAGAAEHSDPVSEEDQETGRSVAMDPEVLTAQADVAEKHGNSQLAANLRRAAELVDLPDDDVLALYEALRPRRATADELEALACSLDRRSAVLCAALVREASSAYHRRGLLR